MAKLEVLTIQRTRAEGGDTGMLQVWNRWTVWPLANQEGTALKRHARRLVDAGLIAFRDSSNGKRWGHRDDQDYIIEAYGYDLSPLAARAEEFVDRFAQIQDDRCQSALNVDPLSAPKNDPPFVLSWPGAA